MWVQQKMVLKHELLENIFLHGQGLNYGAKVCELEDHVGEKRMEFKLVDKAWTHKKNSSYKFS